jgi:hypothetical protein
LIHQQLADKNTAHQALTLWAELHKSVEYVSAIQPGEKVMPVTEDLLSAMRAKAAEAKRIACELLEVLQ